MTKKKMADIFGRRFKDMFFNFSTFRILKAWKNDTKTHGNYCIRITSNKLKTFISSSYNIMISLFSLLFIFSVRCSNTAYCLSRKLTINKNFLCKYFLKNNSAFCAWKFIVNGRFIILCLCKLISVYSSLDCSR